MNANAPSRELGWMVAGHKFFASCLDAISDRELDGPSALPGWTGRQVLSHVGHNARALARLAHWAETGEATPMYPSPTARDEEIETGAGWPVSRLREFVDEEQQLLSAALDRLADAHWDRQVVTAQGRTVPAAAVPWLRSRELWIHACDLSGGGAFASFPDDFVDALIDDALKRRSTTRFELARWLTGRGIPPGLRSASGAPLPELPPWL